jgi:hypothetical protein
LKDGKPYHAAGVSNAEINRELAVKNSQDPSLVNVAVLQEYFDYASSRIPPQGRWRIYGLGLPESILRKVYHENAERVLGLKLTG